jgi:hypothetical protein
MRIRFLEIAQIELDDAIAYYNYEAPGLGDAFLTKVLSAATELGHILKHGTPARIERGGVKLVVSLTESFTK